MSLRTPAPDPVPIRESSLSTVERLHLPIPPSTYPLVWEPGDHVELRPLAEIEGRMAVLNVVLARCFGMPAELAAAWLLDAHLLDRLTPLESRFVMSGEGDERSFVPHYEAVFALAWILGIAMDLDPARPAADGLMDRLPNLPAEESYQQWRARTLTAPRAAAVVATALDLYYCLDWAYLTAEHEHLPLPGMIDSNTIGQRRWALEWAVVFSGPYHGSPPGWEEVDLST